MVQNLSERHKFRPIIKTSRHKSGNMPPIILIAVLLLTGCSHDTRQGKDCNNRQEVLLDDYKSFYRTLQKKQTATTADLIAIIKKRNAIENVLFALDNIDSTSFSFRDSIDNAIFHLVDSNKRTLKDYLDITNETNGVQQDTLSRKLMASAHRFYNSLDSIPIFKLSNTGTVKTYERILNDAIQKGFKNKTDILTFLRKEDRVFRSFLVHLSTLGNIQLTKVQENSAAVMKQMIKLTEEESPLLTTDESIILLTIRNNRRLLQNSIQCINDIQNNKVKGSEQETAYSWMLLQPWVSFDKLSFALMDEEQMKTCHVLAEETQKCTDKLTKTAFSIDEDKLSSILIKTIIVTR